MCGALGLFPTSTTITMPLFTYEERRIQPANAGVASLPSFSAYIHDGLRQSKTSKPDELGKGTSRAKYTSTNIGNLVPMCICDSGKDRTLRQLKTALKEQKHQDAVKSFTTPRRGMSTEATDAYAGFNIVWNAYVSYAGKFGTLRQRSRKRFEKRTGLRMAK